VLDDVLVRSALLSLGADAAKIDARPGVGAAIDRAAANATVRALRDRLGPASAIPLADVRAYYDQHPERYAPPPRYRLWRILTKTREDAQAVLDTALADPTPKTWGQLARDRSEDKATALRSGDLGFITTDGASSEPGLHVDPGVVRAALSVQDGELVRAPVTEGDSFAVIWRRGSTTPPKRSLDDVAASIREILADERLKRDTDELVATLRAARVRDVDAGALDRVDLGDE
jgi:hypothetical protein